MSKEHSIFRAIVSLFFLWALAHNLNPILISKLRESLSLSDAEAMLVDSAFYITYFFVSIPASWIINRWGYQRTIAMGLFLFAFGIFCFLPASFLNSYPVFLASLLLVGSGITILEAAANPLITLLSDDTNKVFRLNFAQSFNGLGAVFAAGIGGYLLLDDSNRGDALMTWPFVFLSLVLIGVMFYILSLRFPVFDRITAEVDQSNYSVWKEKAFVFAMFAQFFYVGSQIGISSFFIRYSTTYLALSSQESAYYLSGSMVLFTLGRFIGSSLLKKQRAEVVLFVFSCGAILTLLGVVYVNGFSMMALLILPFFMSVMFPTIFAMGIGSLKAKKSLGSSLIVMTISGGALIPYIMAKFTEYTSEISMAYSVPIVGFLVVLFFALSYKKLVHE